MRKVDPLGLSEYHLQVGISAIIMPASGSVSISIGVDGDTGHVGIGITGGLGVGAGESVGPSVGGGYDGGSSVSTGVSSGKAVGITILPVNGETLLDDSGHATGGGGSIGSPGAGTYVEQRKTLMWDLSQALIDGWNTAKGWFSH